MAEEGILVMRVMQLKRITKETAGKNLVECRVFPD